MCSFYFSSSFTIVPLDETIQFCLNKQAICSPRSTKTIPLRLKVLLELATKKTEPFYFLWSDYDQIDGVAVGSPLGPVMANILMCHFEEKWVLNSNVRPSVLFRYVDDTFTLFDSKDIAVLRSPSVWLWKDTAVLLCPYCQMTWTCHRRIGTKQKGERCC